MRACAVDRLLLVHEHVRLWRVRSTALASCAARRRTGGRAAASLLLALSACRPPAVVPPPVKPSGMAADIAYLASRALAGREARSPGNDSAAVFLARRHQALGIPGAFPGLCGDQQRCRWSYFQYFTSQEIAGHNVGAFIRGSHPTLYKEFIVVGAHYDHIGPSGRFALDPDLQQSVRPGADDNASGTAALLELARRLAASPPARSVLLVHFDAEEWGLVGSRAFVQQPPIPSSTIVFMLNMDMVGRLFGRALLIDGSAADLATRDFADSVARAVRVPTARTLLSAGRSDHSAFSSIGVPALSLTSGYHSDYHTTTDIPQRLDLAGLTRVVDVAEALVRAAAVREWPPRQTSFREPARSSLQ